METEKLYDRDPFCRRFTAKVLECRERNGDFLVCLDRTAFYPEGGGQPADQGTLGEARVWDVHEKEGVILHTCDRPLEAGTVVTGELDWKRRFDHMQAHSGEHIVSGLIHSLYGYDNVGFHMGAEWVTIDFNGPITEEQMAEVERRANEKIWEDGTVEVLYPTAEELAALEYRSKKELTGRVRIVRFPGADTCACCGTHVVRAGQVGLVKLLSCQVFRSGVRMELLCGRRALEYLSAAWEQNREIGRALSVKGGETFRAVSRMKEELAQVKMKLTALENEGFARQAEEWRGKGDVLLFEKELSPDAVRRSAIALSEVCGGRAAVFSGREGEYKYAIGLAGGDLRGLTKAMNAALGGRGGGKPDFVQGGVAATEAEIRAFFETYQETQTGGGRG